MNVLEKTQKILEDASTNNIDFVWHAEGHKTERQNTKKRMDKSVPQRSILTGINSDLKNRLEVEEDGWNDYRTRTRTTRTRSPTESAETETGDGTVTVSTVRQEFGQNSYSWNRHKDRELGAPALVARPPTNGSSPAVRAPHNQDVDGASKHAGGHSTQERPGKNPQTKSRQRKRGKRGNTHLVCLPREKACLERDTRETHVSNIITERRGEGRAMKAREEKMEGKEGEQARGEGRSGYTIPNWTLLTRLPPHRCPSPAWTVVQLRGQDARQEPHGFDARARASVSRKTSTQIREETNAHEHRHPRTRYGTIHPRKVHIRRLRALIGRLTSKIEVATRDREEGKCKERREDPRTVYPGLERRMALSAQL
ncbi:hypothetical protein B0H13DRAFT_1923374 [Mycena leptocephala]|nr:hypothetical protein B0H13DRAFT_1923374 [Mycena leptocephala]